VPPQAGSAGAVSTAADSLKFIGKTPLTSAVRQAAEALKYTEDKATVILITDGLETCKGDPCALGKELRAAGVDFTVNVVGFGLTADEGKQVACLADNTGGKYIQASDEKALQDA
ncbi:MAG: VWA domain-containing protein, partial [Mesorhizobium sp.]